MSTGGGRAFGRTGVIVAAIAAGITGCGDDGGSARAADAGSAADLSGRACELVTEPDAARVFGEPAVVDEDAPAAPLAAASCVYVADDGTSFKLLQLSFYEGEQFFGNEAFEDEQGFETVEDLGDEAFFVDVLGTQLQVLVGSTTLVLDLSGFNVGDPGFDEATVKRRLTDLARRVLERL